VLQHGLRRAGSKLRVRHGLLNPALLPPNTPMFRDLNAVGFAQDMRPGK
jgi:hypothetical protein